MGFFKLKNRVHTPQAPRQAKVYSRLSGGTFINESTAMEVSAYYSGVIYISTQVAKLPIQIKNKDNQIVDPRGITRIINKKPNLEMTAMFFWLNMIQTAIHKGNAFAEIERDLTGRAVNIWPLPTEKVSMLRDTKGRIYYRVADGHVDGRGDAVLFQKDIFHLKNFHTTDGLMGQGIIAYAIETLGISAGADKFANALFGNGGLPSGVIEVEGELTEEAAIRLKEGWQKNHGGRKTGGTAVLEGGAKFKPISHDPAVLQFLESRKFSVVEIARFLRVPPSKLYDQDTSTYNNIEHDNLRVAVDTLDAWCTNIEQEIDDKIISGYGGAEAQYNMNRIFRGDMRTRSEFYKDQLKTGAMSPNEIRREEGREEYPEGNEFYIESNNLTPISRINEIIDSNISKSNNESKINEAITNSLKS